MYGIGRGQKLSIAKFIIPEIILLYTSFSQMGKVDWDKMGHNREKTKDDSNGDPEWAVKTQL